MPSPAFLVIEHSRDDLFFIERAFRHTGISAIICSRFSEAKAYLLGSGSYANREQFPFPAAIISDLYPTIEPPMELLRWVKTNTFTADLPYFIVTDFISARQHVDAESFPDTLVFRKPLSGLELESMFGKIIQYVLASAVRRFPAPNLFAAGFVDRAASQNRWIRKDPLAADSDRR